MSNYCVTLIGAKGGVGTTVFASNLAAALARDTKNPVLLLELNPFGRGDIEVMLGAEEKLRSVIDLLPVAHKLHEESAKDFIAKHRLGFWILPLLSSSYQMLDHSEENFLTLLSVLRSSFPIIVIDAGSQFNPLNFVALRISCATFLILEPDVFSLYRAKRHQRTLINSHYPKQQIYPILSKTHDDDTIGEKVIKKNLKVAPLSSLPDTPKDIQHSLNQNVPLVLAKPKSLYSRVVEDLTHRLFASKILFPTQAFDLKPDLPLVTLQKVDFAASAKSHRDQTENFDPKEYERIASLKLQVHSKLLEVLNLRGINISQHASNPAKLTELKDQVCDTVNEIVQDQPGIKDFSEQQQISKEVLDEALGLGPLEDLLNDDSISEIMVNRSDQIYIEKNGILELYPSRFTSDKHLLGVIERIVAPVGRRIDEKTPMVDARLKDGSRVHAVIPPLAVDGPILTIRKFSKTAVSIAKLVEYGSLTKQMAEFFNACVQARLNIIISGGTGTGKTTLLNILSSFISEDERIITVEDAAELHLPQEHVGRLEARPPNLQGEGAIPIRELVRNTLRMRPDRIIVGECRGAEALDMLQAMNTGHDGSMTTIHSNSPRDCLSRLETLVMFAGMDLPSKAIREQISSAINLIIQLTRYPDGSRRISVVSEVTGIEAGTITTQDIFTFQRKGVDADGRVQGKFMATGLIPSFMQQLQEMGIEIPYGLFGADGDKKKKPRKP